MNKEGLLEHLEYCSLDTDIVIRIGNTIYSIQDANIQSSKDRLILIANTKGEKP